MTNEQAFAKARELTADNRHQESALLIAKHFGCDRIARAITGVILIHEARGHMDHPMTEMMDLLRRELYDAVETTHGTDTRNAVYRCF